MDRDQFRLLVKGMKAVYAQPTFIPDQDAFRMWFALLGDLPYEVASAAIKKYMLTNKFPPTVAEIREQASEIVNGTPLTWGGSWDKAMKAVRRYGSYNQQAALESLDPLTRRCVETIGFMTLCMSENLSIERAHYQRIFESYSRQEQNERKMPLELSREIDNIRLEHRATGIAIEDMSEELHGEDF